MVSKGIPELVEAMDSGKLSIFSASVLADVEPEMQRAVLKKKLDEDRWAARGVQKRLRRAKRERERLDAEQRSVLPKQGDSIRLYHCPFQKLEEFAGIEPNSVNLVLTDIPYGQEFLPQVAELGAFAVGSWSRVGCSSRTQGSLGFTRYSHPSSRISTIVGVTQVSGRVPGM